MIKSTLYINDVKKPEFPILARHKQYKFVLFFVSENTGIVVVGGHPQIIGNYRKSWTSVFNTTIWEILPVGTTITLEIE